MSLHDESGHPVQLTADQTLKAWNATVRGFLAHAVWTPDQLQKVLKAAPDFGLAKIAKGLFLMLLGRAEACSEARTIAADIACLQRQGALDARERLYASALSDWLDGSPSSAAAQLDKVHHHWPGDALALKLAHAIRFMLGHRFAMRQSLEQAMRFYHADHPLAGYVHGCYAFALEETGTYDAAERQGRRALELAPDDAWALHAVTHVYEMTARARDGVRFVHANEAAWSHCNNFSYHVWWHLALFYLEMGDYDAVLSLYDNRVRHDQTDDYRDIANATSLLMRLELEGRDVGARWAELADLAEQRVNDGSVVFADLHYMLALTGSGRGDAADRLAQRLREAGAEPKGEMDMVAGHTGAPVADGLRAFKNADYRTAFRQLATARPHLQSIGGSHAQRDVFERITIDAAIRAGAWMQARGLIDQRNRIRGAPDGFARSRISWLEHMRRHGMQRPEEDTGAVNV